MIINGHTYKAIVIGLVTKWRTANLGAGALAEQRNIAITVKPDPTTKGLNRVSMVAVVPNTVVNPLTGVQTASGSLQARVEFTLPSTSNTAARNDLLALVLDLLANEAIATSFRDITPPPIYEAAIIAAGGSI